MEFATVMMTIMAALFALAGLVCVFDNKPFVAGFMSFTSVSIICSVAMAVQWNA